MAGIFQVGGVWITRGGSPTRSGLEKDPACSEVVYVGSQDHHMYALDSASGELIWKFKTAGPVASSPALDEDGRIYFGSNDGHVYSLETDGSLRWKVRTGSIVSSSPFVDMSSGALYAPSEDSTMYCITLETGAIRWYFMGSIGGVFKRSSPVVATDGMIYIGSVDTHVYAVTPYGTQLWYESPTVPNIQPLFSSPTLYNNTLIICGDDKIFGMGLDDGKVLVNGPLRGNCFSSAAAQDGVFYVGSWDSEGAVKDITTDGAAVGRSGGYISAFDFVSGKLWDFQTGADVDATPAIGINGDIYVGSFDKFFYALTPDGNLKWKYKTGGIIISSAAINSEGSIFVGSLDTSVYAFESSGELKWTFKTGGAIFSSPGLGPKMHNSQNEDRSEL